MIKEDLIKKLESYPDGVDVCVVDLRKNINRDWGDGCADGIYSDFEVSIQPDEMTPEDQEPILAIHIENDDYDEDGIFAPNGVIKLELYEKAADKNDLYEKWIEELGEIIGKSNASAEEKAISLDYVSQLVRT